MSRMVQCPKCRAILQEPPPGNPYYKCGSCFTVLQAKHATAGSGPPRPVGEDIPGHGTKNLTRRQVRPFDDGPDESSSFRRQKTLPSRLENREEEVEEHPENGHAANQAEDNNEVDTSSFRRQRTLPSRLPHATRQEPLPQRAAGATRGGPGNRQAADDSAMSRARTDRGRGGAGRGSADYRQPMQRTWLDDGPTDTSFRRQKTLPASLGGQEAPPGPQAGGSGRATSSAGDDGYGRGSEFRRQKTLPNRVGLHLGEGPSLQRQSSERGKVQRSVGDEGLGNKVAPPDLDDEDTDYMFRRQKTLPSKMPAGQYGDEEEDEEEEEEERPVYGRQKTLPSRFQQDDGKGQGLKQSINRLREGAPGQYMPQHSGIGSKAKQEVVVPARLQQLLSKNQATGSPQRQGLGVDKRIPSALKGFDSLNGRMGRQKEGPEARQALREALLSGARSSSSYRSDSDSLASRLYKGAGRRQEGSSVYEGPPMDEAPANGVAGSGADDGRAGQRGILSDSTLKHRRRISDSDQAGEKQSPSLSPLHQAGDPQHRRYLAGGAEGGEAGEGDFRQGEPNEDETQSRNSEDTTVEHSDPEEDWEVEEDPEGGRTPRIRGVPQALRKSEWEDSRGAAGDAGLAKRPAPAEQKLLKPQPPDVGRGGYPMLPAPDIPQVVQCQHCTQMLAVPPNLPPSKRGIQKLRCGKCLQVSSYAAFLGGGSMESYEDSVASGSESSSSFRSQSRSGRRMVGSGQYQEFQYPEEGTVGGRSQRGLAMMEERGGGDPNGMALRDRQRPGGLQGSARRGSQGPAGGRQVEEYRRRVSVNGLAVSDWVVEKAEERAGPVHPGDYWYDSRAGFWGVFGGPCLGIIPPGIQEIDTPMPRDCAGGNTRVLVNGRELHKRDLELLKRRGLADTPNKSYIIDIYGRVTDEQTGAELRGLGKLAPSLEDRRRGGGMFVPS